MYSPKSREERGWAGGIQVHRLISVGCNTKNILS